LIDKTSRAALQCGTFLLIKAIAAQSRKQHKKAAGVDRYILPRLAAALALVRDAARLGISIHTRLLLAGRTSWQCAQKTAPGRVKRHAGAAQCLL